MIIDAHTHVHADKDGMGEGHDARLETLISNLEDGPVDKAVILAEAVDVPYVKRIDNEFVAECCKAHPGKLIGFASVHPLENDAPAQLEQAVRQGGLEGLKLHPRFQGVSAADPRIVPVVEKAVELDVPVAIDALLWKPTPLAIQVPLNIDTLCKRVPAVRIIMSHAGGFRFMDALAVVMANENVYLEVSGALGYFVDTPFEDQFMFVLRQAGAGRVIYGSDYPQQPMRPSFDLAETAFKKHGFGEEERARIFGQNLVALLPGGQ